METTKQCVKCYSIKTLSEFSKDKYKKDGHHTVCKLCKKAYDKRYIEENKDRISSRAKEYYLDNSDEIKKNVKKNYINNKYYCLIMNRARRHKHISDGTITFDSLSELLSKQNGCCYYCDKELEFDIKYKVHLDHHIPTISGGLHTISNVIWSCEKCNTTKNKEIPNTLILI